MCWAQLRSYLVSRENIEKLWGWLRKQDFHNRWMPEGPHRLSYVFAGEYPWAAPAADVDELTALLQRLEQPERPAEELQADLEKLYSRIWQWRGFDPEAGRKYVQQTVQFATMAAQAGGRPRLRLPEPAETFGDLAVVSRGSGPVPVLAIGDVGIDAGELYRSFMASTGASYTVYAVSLPGFGGSGQLPWPEIYGPSRRLWLNATEDRSGGSSPAAASASCRFRWRRSPASRRRATT